MTRGFTVDKTYRASTVSAWVEGEPKWNIWAGLKLRGTTPIEIRTWRCNRCGFLESYASQD
jgi:hypothetical protein